eukprot:1732144-Rhodomonas_salina.1
MVLWPTLVLTRRGVATREEAMGKVQEAFPLVFDKFLARLQVGLAPIILSPIVASSYPAFLLSSHLLLS